MAQWVKDWALSLPWCTFDPWPRNFLMLWVLPKKKKKKEERKKKKYLFVRYASMSRRYSSELNKCKSLLPQSLHVRVGRQPVN